AGPCSSIKEARVIRLAEQNLNRGSDNRLTCMDAKYHLIHEPGLVLRSINEESRGDLSDAQEAEEVESRARSRVAEVSQRPFDVGSIALTGLFVLAVFYTIYFMRSILLPIVLALLLSYLLRPIVRGLAQIKIPLPVSAALLLIGFFGLIGYGMSVLATPAAE